ncbi:hypothetical protein [Sphingorhabdus sp. EL138]|uniref:hypothetical protein n=1 Tax=Sphingorhabdus sp. EL138 TaxID=2073156 RepID=UPI000D699D67|nr:hypothetical protein [Sphingorhabdus sp. EL138]
MTAQKPALAEISQNPDYLAHRYDEHNDAFRFIPVDRELHRNSTFLTDKILPDNLPVFAFDRKDVVAANPPKGRVHYIFHSAYCCSTMLARALDIKGISMGFKEPVVLNDLVGWKRRGANPRDVAEVLDQSIDLLARPFGAGETVIIKPSNVVNILAIVMLAMRPDAKAILLHAPLKTYLRSIAKKDLWGRMWVRELFIGQMKDQMIAPFGMSNEDMLMLTDLQVAAVGWLAQHAVFTATLSKFGPDRVKSLNSETLLADKGETMKQMSQLFGLDIDQDNLEKIVSGPAFNRHSKLDMEFDKEAREKEHADAASLHADEIEKVYEWAKVMGERMKISQTLASPLF